MFVATSVNAERHPHMREAILRRTFHVFECGACHQPVGIDKELLYIDLTRREFYGVFPLAAAADPAPCARKIAEAFETALGPGAGEAVRPLAEGMRVRVCFGLEAIGEDTRLGLLLEQAGDPPRLLQDRAFTVERAAYEAFAALPWEDLVARLPGIASGPHVSLLRLARG